MIILFWQTKVQRILAQLGTLLLLKIVGTPQSLLLVITKQDIGTKQEAWKVTELIYWIVVPNSLT